MSGYVCLMERSPPTGGPEGRSGTAVRVPPGTHRPRPALRGLGWFLLAVWLAPVVWLTLTPAPRSDNPDEAMSRYCLVCGDRGPADAILNLLFFVPLGLALAYRRRRVRDALVAGIALSAAVELAQIFVPGRYPTFGDVLWNGLGAVAGALAVGPALSQLARPSPWSGRAAALLAGSSLVLAGWLLGRAPTNDAYYGQWTADLGDMPQYGGTLLSAQLDGLPVTNSRFSDEVHARERLAGDWTLDARVVKGPPPRAVSPIVSVYDSLEAEILVLGADGEDLVLRERTRAKAIRLDHPDLRLPGALTSARVGDTLSLSARSVGQERCLAAGEVESCGLGFTPGRTWGLLLYLEGPSERLRRGIDVLWLFGLFFAVGVASSSALTVLQNGAIVAVLTTAGIALTRLTTPPWWEVAAAVVGLAAGWATFRVARAHLPTV